jgi:hypothetical protein
MRGRDPTPKWRQTNIDIRRSPSPLPIVMMTKTSPIIRPQLIKRETQITSKSINQIQRSVNFSDNERKIKSKNELLFSDHFEQYKCKQQITSINDSSIDPKVSLKTGFSFFKSFFY